MEVIDFVFEFQAQKAIKKGIVKEAEVRVSMVTLIEEKYYNFLRNSWAIMSWVSLHVLKDVRKIMEILASWQEPLPRRSEKPYVFPRSIPAFSRFVVR